MNVTFLGTGTSQGIPVIACKCDVCQSVDFRDKRLRTSILITVDGKNLVVDTGPDFRQQMLRENITQLDAVLFTHEHKDHVAGLDDVRSFNFHQKKDMPVYGRSQVLEALKREFAYAFTPVKYPGVPQINLNQIENETFQVEGIEILPIEVLHYKMPVFGFRIKGFVYITDANYISETEKEKLKGADVLVLNALQKESHISHFTLQQAIDLVHELKPKRAYFTHFSHRLGKHADVSLELPEDIELAYDGLKVTI